MGLGQKLSVNIAPLLLRTGLAATFIWIGTPMLRTMDLTAEQTAILANADIRQPDPASTAPGPAPTPDSTPDPTPDPIPDSPEDGDSATTPPPMSGVSLTRRAGAPRGDGDEGADVVISNLPYSPAQFQSSDQSARRWVLVALTALESAEPISDGDDATPDRSILPGAIGNGGVWVKVGSIAFALIVAFGGYAIILGFFTRVWALWLALCTGLSMWVLELGPAWAARDGLMGFLPDPQLNDPVASQEVWMSLVLHFVVLMSALALLIVGPGKLSLDQFMFGRGEKAHRRDGFADDDD